MSSSRQERLPTAAILTWLSAGLARAMGEVAHFPLKWLPSKTHTPKDLLLSQSHESLPLQTLRFPPSITSSEHESSCECTTPLSIILMQEDIPQQRADLSCWSGVQAGEYWMCVQSLFGDSFSASIVTKKLLMTLTSKIREVPAKPFVGRDRPGNQDELVCARCLQTNPSPVPG